MSRRAKTEARRAQIVHAALTALGDTSLDALSTRRIARLAGLSQPGLFRHFRSRDEILLAVIAQTRERLAEQVQGALEAPGDAPSRLLALVQAVLQHVEETPGVPRLLFGDAAADRAASGPVRGALRHLLSMQRAVVAELVRAGQREGTLSRAADPDEAALLLVGAVQGLVLQWELDEREGPLSRGARPAIALWLRGVAPRPDDAPSSEATETTRQPEPRPPRTEEAHAEKGPAGEDTPPPSAPPPPRATPLSLLDVRPLIAAGRDPLEDILAQVETAGPAGWTCVVAPFAPRPLVALLGARGFQVTLRPLGAADPPSPSPRSRGVWIVEVRGPQAPEPLALQDLEPPEPLQRLLEASASLRPGEALAARVPREPHLLFPRLSERGLRWETVVLPETGEALVRVERPTDAPEQPEASGRAATR